MKNLSGSTYTDVSSRLPRGLTRGNLALVISAPKKQAKKEIVIDATRDVEDEYKTRQYEGRDFISSAAIIAVLAAEQEYERTFTESGAFLEGMFNELMYKHRIIKLARRMMGA